MDKNIVNDEDIKIQTVQDYIEKLKESTIDTKDVRRGILRIKRYVDRVLNYKNDIEDGELTREEIVENFLKVYREEYDEPKGFENYIALVNSQYEACKKILNMVRRDRNGLNALINIAKAEEKEEKEKAAEEKRKPEALTFKFNMREAIIVNLRGAIQQATTDKNRSRRGDKTVTFDDIINKIHSFKETFANKIRDMLISRINTRISFFNEFGYMDEFIEEYNEALKKAGFPELQQFKRNETEGVIFDKDGKETPICDVEDIGVLEALSKEKLEKMSQEELLIVELFWKGKYFKAALENIEALKMIEYLDLWPVILEDDEAALEQIDEKRIDTALRRDLALTYFIGHKDIIIHTPEYDKNGDETPESQQKGNISSDLQQRYLGFLARNNMFPIGTTLEEIEQQCRELESVYRIGNDSILASNIVVDKLRNKDLDLNWGIVKGLEKELEGQSEDTAIAIDMPNFRGTLIIAVERRDINKYFENKNEGLDVKAKRIPDYKMEINEAYSGAMTSILLPTSERFKKYIAEKYGQDPSSPLLEHLATTCAGCKKIKNKKPKKVEDEVK